MHFKRFIVLSCLLLALTSCATTRETQPREGLNVSEIDALKGQWDYDLVTNEGVKIKGFFQVEPSSKHALFVVGQAYFDKGILSTENLRGVWTGSLIRDDKGVYILTFSMRENPILAKQSSESPYLGTIAFQLSENELSGPFSDHGHREGINGTVKARKRS